MPVYSKKFFVQLIQPSWRILVQQLPLYINIIVFGTKNIQYDEYEQKKILDENYEYQRGYESEDDDEKYGIEGLIIEMIDFATDLLKRKNMFRMMQRSLLNFLLCIKHYCLLPDNSV